MTRRMLVGLAFCALLTTPDGMGQAVAREGKPNVIIVLSDDAGYADFGVTGCTQIPTPNIDRLARDGVFCSQGYVSASVCAPSRMGLMTGRYQHRFGAENNCPTKPTPGFTRQDLGLDVDEMTLGDAMRAQGYCTMAVGKWHLGEHDQYHPNRRGFDEFWGFLGGSRSYWPIKKAARGHAMRRNHEPLDEEKEIHYLTDDLTNAALEFMRRRNGKPFFIYLSYNAVHTPMHAKEEDVEQFSRVSPEKRRILAAMTRSMDLNIGRIQKALDELGLTDNTLFVFFNDNGGADNNASSNLPLRGSKGTYWEGGIRVPFIVSWPARLPKGVRYEHPVSSLDLLPTCVAAGGGTMPPDRKLDGVNLLPFLDGTRKEAPHEFLFWRLWRVAAVRHGPWKLVRVAGNPLEEERKLYLPLALINLDDDPGETTNVADRHPAVTKELLRALEAWETPLPPPRWYDGGNWQHWAEVSVKNHRMAP